MKQQRNFEHIPPFMYECYWLIYEGTYRLLANDEYESYECGVAITYEQFCGLSEVRLTRESVEKAIPGFHREIHHQRRNKDFIPYYSIPFLGAAPSVN